MSSSDPRDILLEVNRLEKKRKIRNFLNVWVSVIEGYTLAATYTLSSILQEIQAKDVSCSQDRILQMGSKKQKD